MPIIKRISRNDSMFRKRNTVIMAGGDNQAVAISAIPVPDNLILCDTCNAEINTPLIYLLFLSRRDKHPYGTVCEGCKKRYWPHCEVVDY